jgi:hypothetical protein
MRGVPAPPWTSSSEFAAPPDVDIGACRARIHIQETRETTVDESYFHLTHRHAEPPLRGLRPARPCG